MTIVALNTHSLLRTLGHRFLVAGMLSLTLAACANNAPPAGTDYRANHPLTVEREQVSIAITLPQRDAALSAIDSRNLQRFVRDFVTRGRGQVIVETALQTAALDILKQNGLREAEIAFVAEVGRVDNTAILNFNANRANAPECGDWSDRTSFRPENTPHSNYGCSHQRNLGLIVSDPGDLIQAKPMSGNNARRNDGAMNRYNNRIGGGATAPAPAVDPAAATAQ